MKQYAATYTLIASLLVLFGVELAGGAIGNDERLLALGAISDSRPLDAEYWRLLSYAWLHAGYAHLFANVAGLWWAGRIVERRTETAVMLGIYFACAMIGGAIIALSASINPRPGVSLGASAAISGLLACGLVMLYRPAAAHLGQATWVRLTLWLTLAFAIIVSFLPGVSLVGHVAGLALGALFGFLVPVRAGLQR